MVIARAREFRSLGRSLRSRNGALGGETRLASDGSRTRLTFIDFCLKFLL